MKIRSTLLFTVLLLSLNTFAQFFDSVPYRGAFGISGGTRGTVTGFKGYDPDPSNTDADWTKPWANFAPNAVAYPGDANYNHTNTQFYTAGTSADKVTISSDINSDYHMTSDKWYELSGLIHVLAGATLTIDPGTCIRGSVSNLGGLIITQGAKINAIADRYHPIVITSQKAVGARVRGDWAGLLILGNASTNLAGGQRRFEALPADPLAMYGGVPANDADNSGSIRYMRVEFAGYNYLPDQEINGVTFGAVGSGSHFDYMQSSFANDDAFEWFGGTCSHKYLIAFSGTDDEFDMDEGYRGKCQYFLGLRNAGVTETSPAGACNGLEHDNNTNLGTPAAVNPNMTSPNPVTSPTISNMTLVGPEHPGAFKSSLSTLWQQRAGEAFRLRTNDATGVYNSITWGYPTSINLPNVSNLSPSVQTRASDDELGIRNTVIISSGLPDIRFNSSNFPTTASIPGWPSGVTAWTGIGDMRNWIINGPTTSVYGFTGATGNDTSRTTITTADITQPDYSGVSNGALSQLDYTGCDFTLTATSAFRNTSSFQHPRVAFVAQPTVSVTPSFLPSFIQNIGTPSTSKILVIKVSAVNGVLITAPSGFEVSANGTTGWAASFTKGTTAADTTIYIRLNRTTGGSSSGYLLIASTTTPAQFSAINIAVNGTAVAPATPYVNVTVSSLSFANAVGSPAVKNITVSGKNLTANVVLTAPTNFEVSTTSGSGFASTVTLNQVNGALVSTIVYVRYNPSTAGSHSGNLSITTTGADAFTVSLTGGSMPAFTITPSMVTIGGGFTLQYPVINTTAGVASISYPVTITGTMLTDTVKVNVPTNFEMSIDSAFTSPILSSSTLFLNTSKAATLNQKIYVRYNAATATTNAGNMTIASTGAPVTSTGPGTQIVSLSGRATAIGGKYISMYAPSYQLQFTSVLNVATAPQYIAVAGVNLGTDSVVVNAPANWEVSLTGSNYSSVVSIPNVSGVVAPTLVFVRYNPSVPFALNQFLIVNVSSVTPTPNSQTATNLGLLVFGVASPTVASDLSSLPTFYSTVGRPSYANKIMVSGFDLQGGITVNSTNGFQLSLDSNSFSSSVSISQTSGFAAQTKVYVRYNSTNSGAISGSYVNISTLNGATIPVLVSAVNVLPATPVVTLSTGSLSFKTNVAGATAGKSFTVSAINLLDSLTLTVGSDYEISTDSINYKKSFKLAVDANGTLATLKLFARFNRATAGSTVDTIFFTSTGLATQKLILNGSNTTGVADLNNISSFVMYPNPAQNELNIEFVLDKKAPVTIQIIDISGRIVKEVMNENLSTGNNTININMNEVNNGFYFVRIESMNGTKVTRLMIAK
ncbi:MAG: T9SS type A sorting domain-containing protein [Bacteroidota bacterium]